MNLHLIFPVGELCKVPHQAVNDKKFDWRSYRIGVAAPLLETQADAEKYIKPLISSFIAECDRMYALKQRPIIISPKVKVYSMNFSDGSKVYIQWYMEKDDYILSEKKEN